MVHRRLRRKKKNKKKKRVSLSQTLERVTRRQVAFSRLPTSNGTPAAFVPGKTLWNEVRLACEQGPSENSSTRPTRRSKASSPTSPRPPRRSLFWSLRQDGWPASWKRSYQNHNWLNWPHLKFSIFEEDNCSRDYRLERVLHRGSSGERILISLNQQVQTVHRRIGELLSYEDLRKPGRVTKFKKLKQACEHRNANLAVFQRINLWFHDFQPRSPHSLETGCRENRWLAYVEIGSWW